MIKLLEMGGRPVTLLDGDLVRRHLSSELGFSKNTGHQHRRIGYVASEITKNEVIALCAPIAPYDSNAQGRAGMIEPFWWLHLVHLSTPVEVCEQRDRKRPVRESPRRDFKGNLPEYPIPMKSRPTPK